VLAQASRPVPTAGRQGPAEVAQLPRRLCPDAPVAGELSALWDRIVGRPVAGPVAGVGDRHPPALRRFPLPLAAGRKSEFSRPRHCADLQHPGEPQPAGGYLRHPAAGGWWPCCVGGRRWPPISRLTSLHWQTALYFHLTAAEAAVAWWQPWAAWTVAGLRWIRTLARALQTPVFRCWLACCSELRPWAGKRSALVGAAAGCG